MNYPPKSPLSEARRELTESLLDGMNKYPDHDRGCLVCGQTYFEEAGHDCTETKPRDRPIGWFGGWLCDQNFHRWTPWSRPKQWEYVTRKSYDGSIVGKPYPMAVTIRTCVRCNKTSWRKAWPG